MPQRAAHQSDSWRSAPPTRNWSDRFARSDPVGLTCYAYGVFQGRTAGSDLGNPDPFQPRGPTLDVIEALPRGRWGLVVEDEYSVADDAAYTMRRVGGEAVRPPPDQHEPLRGGR